MGISDCKPDDETLSNGRSSSPPTPQKLPSTECSAFHRSTTDVRASLIDVCVDQIDIIEAERPQDYEKALDEPDFVDTNKLGDLTKINQYGIRKRVAHCMIDIALFAANISQLRILLKAGSENVEFYYFVLSCVSFSLAGQLAFALMILIIWGRESKRLNDTISSAENGSGIEEKGVRKDRLVDILNCTSLIIVLGITLINVCISGFGIELIETNVSDKREISA